MSRIPFLSESILHFQSIHITLHLRMDGVMDESMSMTTAAGGRVAFSHVTTPAERMKGGRERELSSCFISQGKREMEIDGVEMWEQTNA